MDNGGTLGGQSSASRLALVVQLLATATVLAAATAAGAQLFSASASGTSTFKELLLGVGIPAAAVLVVVFVVAMFVRWGRLWRGIALGFWTGLAGTLVLEIVRTTGFRVFESMPGDLPRLMGVLATDRIMQGPSQMSDVIGFADHYWNGAMFGITYVLLVGGYPRRSGVWSGAALGGVYGAVIGTGFLASKVPVVIGAGSFGENMGPKFAITVYLAHLGFGALLGLLVHRFGARLDPLWTVAVQVVRPYRGA